MVALAAVAVEVAAVVVLEAGKDKLIQLKSGTRLTLPIERLVPLFLIYLFKNCFDF